MFPPPIRGLARAAPCLLPPRTGIRTVSASSWETQDTAYRSSTLIMHWPVMKDIFRLQAPTGGDPPGSPSPLPRNAAPLTRIDAEHRADEFLRNAGRGPFEDGQILPDGPGHRRNKSSANGELLQQCCGASDAGRRHSDPVMGLQVGITQGAHRRLVREVRLQRAQRSGFSTRVVCDTGRPACLPTIHGDQVPHVWGEECSH